MKIKQIYKKYSVPPNLQKHMIRVAKVAQFICDHWKGEVLDKNKLIKTALLHDLGNIVKFNMDKYPEFLGSEKSNIEYWIEKQKEIIEKYGSDDHEVTQKMLVELGFGNESIEVVSSRSFANSIEALNSDNWYIKILLYSDLRVLPWGIGTLQERFDDIKDRMPQYNKRDDLEDLFDAVRKIEKQIQGNVEAQLDEITDENLSKDSDYYLNIEV